MYAGLNSVLFTQCSIKDKDKAKERQNHKHKDEKFEGNPRKMSTAAETTRVMGLLLNQNDIFTIGDKQLVVDVRRYSW